MAAIEPLTSCFPTLSVELKVEIAIKTTFVIHFFPRRWPRRSTFSRFRAHSWGGRDFTNLISNYSRARFDSLKLLVDWTDEKPHEPRGFGQAQSVLEDLLQVKRIKFTKKIFYEAIKQAAKAETCWPLLSWLPPSDTCRSPWATSAARGVSEKCEELMYERTRGCVSQNSKVKAADHANTRVRDAAGMWACALTPYKELVITWKPLGRQLSWTLVPCGWWRSRPAQTTSASAESSAFSWLTNHSYPLFKVIGVDPFKPVFTHA